MDSLATQLDIQLPSPIHKIYPTWRNASYYDIFIKRDDLLHPIISGNKWRKLEPQLHTIITTKANTIGSFGGGHSNHIHALSFCCQQLNIQLYAFIRGNYTDNETKMLRDIADWGTKVVYLTKQEYQRRAEPGFCQQLLSEYTLDVLLPEGGSCQGRFEGMHSLVNEIDTPFDFIVIPVASGGTLAGLATSRSRINKILGIAVLKGEHYLEQLVENLIGDHEISTPYQIDHRFHQGGYAKSCAELTQFCIHQSQLLQVPLEPVYSGKVLFALKKIVESKQLPVGSRLLFLHTGGIQAQN